MPAYTVKSLAAEWSCSTTAIYDLIESGALKTFSIGKRGIRIAEDEVRRWQKLESEPQPTGLGTLPSDGAKAATLPTYAMKGLASANG